MAQGQSGLPSGVGLGPTHIAIERFGEDFAVEAYLRDPYQPLRPQG